MKNSLMWIRNIFLGVFITATLVSFANYSRSTMVLQANSLDGPDSISMEAINDEIKISSFIISASMTTSLVSLLGFILSAVLKIRKDKRESLESALSLKQKELDLQRALLELEELKKK